MAQKSLYIRESDTPIWDAAERIAARDDTSVARVVIAALTDYLPKVATKPTQAVRWADIGADTPEAA
jgi:hypothetical protein